MAPGDFYLRDSSRITRRRVVWTHLRNTIYCRATTIIKKREKKEVEKNAREKNTYMRERRRKKRERSERKVVNKRKKKKRKKKDSYNGPACVLSRCRVDADARAIDDRSLVASAGSQGSEENAREKRSMVEGHVSLSLSLSLSLPLLDRQFTR